MPDDSDISALSTSADTPLSAEASALDTEQLAPVIIEPSEAQDPFAPEFKEIHDGPAPNAKAAVDRAELPGCFASIESQLQKPAISKLKVVDSSMAMIQLKCNGQSFGPIEMAYLVAGNFADNCVQALGTDGLICCAVNDKRFKPFFFAFQAQASEANKAMQADPTQLMMQMFQKGLAEIDARVEKRFEIMRNDMALSGGGRSSSFADELENFQKLAGILKTLQPAPLPVAPGGDMSSQVQGMVTLLGGVTDMQTKLKEAAGVIAPDKSAAENVKEVLEIPFVKDLAEVGVDAVKAKIAGKEAVANPSSEPSEPDVDPFAVGAA